MMLQTTDLNIIYVNEAVQEMFQEAESDIRQDLPHFEAKKFIECSLLIGLHNDDAESIKDK